MDDVELEVDDDYYAFLNLPKDVSIRAACSHLRSTHVSQWTLAITIYFRIYYDITKLLQATTEQINASYKSLSRMYHPDKHNDPSKKQDAEMIFNRIKKAHSVCWSNSR